MHVGADFRQFMRAAFCARALELELELDEAARQPRISSSRQDVLLLLELAELPQIAAPHLAMMLSTAKVQSSLLLPPHEARSKSDKPQDTI